MSNSREKILNKLRSVQQPFPDVPPRPKTYLPVTAVDDSSPEGLLARFSTELERLMGQIFVVDGDAAARDKVLELLESHNAKHILAWDFQHIPVEGLEAAIRNMGIQITQPEMHDEFRAETLETIRDAEVGLTGVDAAAATTGTLIFTTGKGKGRIPTVLAPAHIAVVSLDQMIRYIEDWFAAQRAKGMRVMQDSANVCFVSGPSRTADIEMELILGVHGPGVLQVIVKR